MTEAPDALEPSDVHPKSPRKKRRRLLLMVLCFLLFLIVGFTSNFIPSESMEPNLRVGDHVITMRKWLAYPFGKTPSRGDIIIFRLPKDKDPYNTLPDDMDAEGTEEEHPITDKIRSILEGVRKRGDLLIKRVMALPGETIYVKGKDVYIKGTEPSARFVKFAEAYDRLASDDTFALFATEQKPLTVGKDELFVLGDNRITSDDGRFWGALKQSDVVGKFLFVLYNEGSEGSNTRRAESMKDKKE